LVATLEDDAVKLVLCYGNGEIRLALASRSETGKKLGV
jgi:hypothetical protein